MTVKGQLKYMTGRQAVKCEECSQEMNITVSGEKRDSRGNRYRDYHGGCRYCKTLYSGALWHRAQGRA
ncbi:MAG: hypothetical protein JXA21_10495 [Anaerolineae bacterium]|nr:hypothetical protein [Anaerolineae bacterium]